VYRGLAIAEEEEDFSMGAAFFPDGLDAQCEAKQSNDEAYECAKEVMTHEFIPSN
jgi:hypothetical protein